MGFDVKNIFKKFKKPSKKVIIIASVVLVVVLIFVIILSVRLSKKNSSDTEEMRTAEAYESVFTSNIDVSGYLEAADIQNVQFRGTGAITGVFVEAGDIVKKGQLLATIDDTSQRYSLLRAEQELEKAESTASEKELELLRLQVQTAKNNMEYTQAVANFDGVVSEVNIAVGDYAEAAKTLNLMQVVDLSYLKATVQVDEIDVKYLKEGQEIELSFDSLPGEKIKARIDYIPMLGTYNTNSGIGVKNVRIVIDDPKEGLYPGYSFSSNIILKGEKSSLMIQSASVTSRRGKSYVYKLNDEGNPVQIEVTVRYLGEGVSEVLSGDIKAGDTYVVNPSSVQIGGSGRMMPMGPPPGGF